MPPRRPIAKGADSDSRRKDGAPSGPRNAVRSRSPVDNDLREAEAADRFPDEDSGYRTGSDYPVADDPDPDRPELEGGADRDVYGEEEPWEEEAYSPADRTGADDGRSYTRSEMEAVSDDEDGELESMDAGPDSTRAGPPVHLEIVEGPDRGKKKRFSGVRMVIGRTPGCEFQLSDQSVSRRHAELIMGGGGLVLRDLGSGNGTKINGERIGEQVLTHGDVIGIGKTKLRFHDELAALELARQAEEQRAEEARKKQEETEVRRKEQAEARAKAEAEAAEARKKREEEDAKKRAEREVEEAEKSARRKKVIRTLGGTFGTLLALVVISAVVINPPGQTADEKTAAEKMSLARAASEKGEYEEAARLIQSALLFDPDVDPNGELAVARKEAELQAILDRARKALDEQRFEDARLALTHIPEDSERGQKAKKELDDERIAREQAVLLAAASASVGENNLEEARKLLAFLLPEGKKKVEGLIAKAEEAERLRDEADAKKSKKQREEDRRRHAAQRRAYLVQAFGPVSLKFHSGDYERAALDCGRIIEANAGADDVRTRGRELERLIPLFARNYEDGQRKIKAGNPGGAEGNLRKARELYQQIGLPGPLGVKLDQTLANSLVASGKASLARKDLARAAVAYRDAMRLDPDVSGAREGSAMVQTQAERLYLEAVSLKNRRPQDALAKLRVVLLAATPGSGVYAKAQGQIAELETPLPEGI